jgi:hypothetical protein
MPIVGVSASADGELFASVAEDESAKVFDVVNFGASDGGPLLVSSVCSNPSRHANAHAYAPLRYDQYDQAWIHAKILLLGASEGPSAEYSCRVSAVFFRPCLLFAHDPSARNKIQVLFDYTMAVGTVNHWRRWRRSIGSRFI